MPDTAAYAGMAALNNATSEYGVIDFIARMVASEMATAMLVQVVAVASVGEVAPVGLIDVRPMVAQIDGRGQATPHGVIHNVPYFRLAGGVNAVIIDPAVGDIGVAIFGSHDQSSVKKTKAPGNPGSRRRFDWADAMYLGGFLSDTPANYIRFDASGNVTIKPAATVTIEGNLVVTGEATASGIHLSTHTHSGVTTGGGTSGPPVP